VSESDWKEVRVGLARPVSNKTDERNARMSKYPEVVGQLVSAVFDQGMSKQTQVYAVADGGHGYAKHSKQSFRFNIYPDRPSQAAPL